MSRHIATPPRERVVRGGASDPIEFDIPTARPRRRRPRIAPLVRFLILAPIVHFLASAGAVAFLLGMDDEL